jgi:hypothetical protein
LLTASGGSLPPAGPPIAICLPDLVHGQVAGADGRGKGDPRTLPGPAQFLAFALRTRQVHGIWGGLTEQERHQVTKTSQGT